MVLSMITSLEGRPGVNRPSSPTPHFIVPQILLFFPGGWWAGLLMFSFQTIINKSFPSWGPRSSGVMGGGEGCRGRMKTGRLVRGMGGVAGD